MAVARSTRLDDGWPDLGRGRGASQKIARRRQFPRLAATEMV
jgi:hypothetical protein